VNEIDPAIEDARLIEMTVAGDAEAFGRLIARYQDRLYNSLVHYLRNTTEAEDVLQEAFVLAWTRLASFQGKSSFYTWLYRIAFNTAISRRRRQRHHVSVERDLMGAATDIGGSIAGPEAGLEAEERAGELMAAMGRLNEEHRAILVLREMDELSYEDISEILDLPVGTVRSRLHRARSQLREQLAGYFQKEH
jgi:RNA polymerase sigma-70 factor (ECF subfamily)